MSLTNSMPDDTPLTTTLTNLEEYVYSEYKFWTLNGIPFFFPFAERSTRKLIRTLLYTLLSLPLLATLLVIGGALTVGTPETITSLISSITTISEWTTTLIQNPRYLIFAVLAWYLIGILYYTPSDRRNYKADSSPSEASSAWMNVSVCALTALIPGTYLIYMVLTQTKLGFIMNAFILLGIAVGGRWLNKIHVLNLPYATNPYNGNLDGKTKSFRTVTSGYSAFVIAGLVISLLFFGITAIFLVYLALMVYTARQLRWTIYEDTNGYKPTNPSVRLWTAITRIPLAYGIALTIMHGGFTPTAAYYSSAPLLATVGYLKLRKITLGGTMKAKAYDAYEQMSPGEESRHKEGRFWRGLLGRKAPSDEKKFAGEVMKVNYGIRSLNSDLIDRFGEEDAPLVDKLSDDPDEFDEFTVRAQLREVEDFLQENEHDGAYVQLVKVRSKLKELVTVYKIRFKDEDVDSDYLDF